MSQIVEKIDPRVLTVMGDYRDKLPILKDMLLSEERPGWAPDDTVDVSILPRLLSRKHFEEVSTACRLVTEAAMRLFSKYLAEPASVPEMKLNHFLNSLELRQRVVSGNARYDFLKQGDVIKLTELNFVGVGCSGYSTNINTALLELFPELASFALAHNPVLATKARLQEQQAGTVLILTAANDTGMSGLDKRAVRGILAASEPRLLAHIVTEDRYPEVTFSNGSMFHGNVKMDAVYPRHMYGLESLQKNEAFCRRLVGSDAFMFDHFKLMLLEDKDLRYLSSQDSRVTPYLAHTMDVSDVPNPQDYVVKVRDAHAGEGVSLAREHGTEKHNAIMQERIHINRYPVDTIRGSTGDATFETSFYVSYRYHLDTRELETSCVSGCLTRASFGELITGQQIIIIPVLVEK